MTTHTIRFRLKELEPLVREIAGADTHHDSWLDQESGRHTGPALMWVKDDGTYLMGNQDRPEGELPLVVYGQTVDGVKLDGAQWDLCRDICGGDDFAEYLTLADTPLVRPDVVADALKDGYRWLTLTVDNQDAFTLEVAR